MSMCIILHSLKIPWQLEITKQVGQMVWSKILGQLYDGDWAQSTYVDCDTCTEVLEQVSEQIWECPDRNEAISSLLVT